MRKILQSQCLSTSANKHLAPNQSLHILIVSYVARKLPVKLVLYGSGFADTSTKGYVLVNGQYQGLGTRQHRQDGVLSAVDENLIFLVKYCLKIDAAISNGLQII